MTDDTHTPRKNSDGAKAALLALASSPEGGSGQCPSSEELAAFVENPPHGEERQRMLDHLGECSECYEEWLYLHHHIHGKSRRMRAGSVIRFLNSRKTLAWAGSVMGIAAAVVVFLQLRTDYVGLKKLETAAPKAVNERTIDQLPGPMEDAEDTEIGRIEQKERPVPQQKREAARKPAAQGQQFSLEKSSGALQTGMQATEKLAAPGATGSSMTTAPPPAVAKLDEKPEPDADGVEALPAFAEKLRNGCLAKKWQKTFWQEIEEELVQIGNREDTVGGSRSLQQLSQLVSRAAQNGGDEKICIEIMAILDGMRYK